MPQLFQTRRPVGALRVAVRQGAVFRRGFRRGDLSFQAAHARVVGLRTELLCAEYDARPRWPSSGVGLGQWLPGRTRLEWLSVFAAPVELFTGWRTPAKPGA